KFCRYFHVSITVHESLNFLNIGQKTLNYLAYEIRILLGRLLQVLREIQDSKRLIIAS
ncbi:DUF3967 domain-containing protein, partial [Bacillus cereus]